MAKTIEQIQAMITDGYDQRQIINELADYVQANPSSPGSSGYLSYVAEITQSSTNPPTANIFTNTLGGTPTWFYDGVGSFSFGLAGAFTVGKTWCSISHGFDSGIARTLAIRDAEDGEYIEIKCVDADGNSINFNGDRAFIEIRVYP